jgi:type VI protein secretion system component Hcp
MVAKKAKKKTGKKVKDLTAKAKNVKGGVSMSYGQIEWTYTKQKPDGTANKP